MYFHSQLKISCGVPQRSVLGPFFPDSRLQNKEKEKKENERVFFRKLILLKSKFSRCFLLLSLLEPLMQSNLDAKFLEIVTSQAVLDHWGGSVSL